MSSVRCLAGNCRADQFRAVTTLTSEERMLPDPRTADHSMM